MSDAPAHFDLRNVNSLWCSVLVETLVRAGVTRAVISPGSRSTPLTFALARHPGVQTVPVLDERSAAFFALGQAKRLMQPVALVCTSGTAGANYYPAVIEAQESGVPLLIITADRPPEMRACASGQTIDQQKLFGDHVNFFHELATPEASEPLLRYLRQTVAQAVNCASRPAGPVHLNAPFRDPLPPVADDGRAGRVAGVIDWRRFFGQIGLPPPTLALSPAPELMTAVHGVIVTGPWSTSNARGEATLIGTVAAKLGWPVLADGLSPVRNHAGLVPNLVTIYDAILRNPAMADRLKPEVVLCLGEWPTSKVLRGWLEASDAPVWFVSERTDNRDALHLRTRQMRLSLGALAAGLPEATDENGYTRMWSVYEQRARAALDSRLAAAPELIEPKAAWLLAKHLPPGTPLCLANSMPVRDVEYVWPPGDRGIEPCFSRGANGIDGTLSTALGVAHAAADRPVALLTGDLALLHDSNGFLLRPKFRGSLTIVLINNRGGGIFEHLPVAKFEPPFEEFFATPQEVNFAKLCDAYGVDHVTVRDWAHFTELISILPPAGVRVLEVTTDRKRDAATRQRWFAEVAASLG